MNEYKPTPEEESAQRRADNDREGQKDIAAALAEIEGASHESAGPAKVVDAVPTGSPAVQNVGEELSAWIADRLREVDFAIRDAAAQENFREAHEMCLKWTACNTVAGQLRALMGRPYERQPQENARGVARPQTEPK